MNSRDSIAADWELWQEHVDPHATMTRGEFDAMTVDDRLALLTDTFGPEEPSGWKSVLCLAGAPDNQQSALVELRGTYPGEKLTPKLARRAARIAFGHSRGVWVQDRRYRIEYRLYANTARKVYLD